MLYVSLPHHILLSIYFFNSVVRERLTLFPKIGLHAIPYTYLILRCRHGTSQHLCLRQYVTSHEKTRGM
jgi:hypothetical protein